MALVPARSNVLIAGISKWEIYDYTDSDHAYYTIPYPRKTKVTIDPIASGDSQGRPNQYAYDLKASACFPAIRTESNFISLLGVIGENLIDHKITLINGQIISSKPTTSTPSPTGFGVGLKVVSDKDMGSEMYVQMDIARKLLPAEYTDILTTANAPASNSANVSDILYPMASLAFTDIVPAGFQSFAFDAVGGAYGSVISNLRNAKFTATLLTTMDGHGQPFGYAWKVEVSLESLETKQAEALKWPALVGQQIQAKITFINGMTCTLPTQLGITHAYASEKDGDDTAVMKVAASGIIQNVSTNWSGLWS